MLINYYDHKFDKNPFGESGYIDEVKRKDGIIDEKKNDGGIRQTDQSELLALIMQMMRQANWIKQCSMLVPWSLLKSLVVNFSIFIWSKESVN